MLTAMPSRYRVIQWATGSVGRESLKAILMHPQLELARVSVPSEAKHGRDAGELCALPATGVRATAKLDEILACDADCVACMPRLTDLDEVCMSLASFERSDATIDDHVHAADVATAMQAVNSIPALCETTPGMRAASNSPPCGRGSASGARKTP